MINSYIVRRARTDFGTHTPHLVVRAHSLEEAMHMVPLAEIAAPWEPATRSEHRLRWDRHLPTSVTLLAQPEAYPEIVSVGASSEDCVYRMVPSTHVRELAERIFVALATQRVGATETASEAFELAEAFVAEAAKRGIR